MNKLFPPAGKVAIVIGGTGTLLPSQLFGEVMAHQQNGTTINISSMAPGQQNRFLLMNEDDTLAECGQQIIDHTPQARFGNFQDPTETLLWLASDVSRFVTGVVLPVDGGFSAFGEI